MATKIAKPIPFNNATGHGGIKGIFESFGYTPTEAEIASFGQSAWSGKGGHDRAVSAVGSYINSLEAEEKRKAEDPLAKQLAEDQKLSASQRGESADLAQKAIDVYKAAPQLFGGLQPDQIQQYLAPAREQFRGGMADTEGAFGRRGLAGSNIEANAMAEQARLYQQNVLAQALQLGLQQQSNLSNAYANRSGQLLGAAEGASGRELSAGTTMSGQAAESSQFMASLPLYLRQMAMQEQAMRDAQSKSTPWGAIGSIAGMGLGAALAPFTGGMSIPMGMALGGSFGGGVGSLFQGNNAGAMSNFNSFPYLAAMGGGRGAPLLTNPNTMSTPNMVNAGTTLVPGQKLSLLQGGGY